MAFAKYIYADKHFLNTETNCHIYLCNNGTVTRAIEDIEDANIIKNRKTNRSVISRDLKKFAFHLIEHESTKQFLKEMIAWLFDRSKEI